MGRHNENSFSFFIKHSTFSLSLYFSTTKGLIWQMKGYFSPFNKKIPFLFTCWKFIYYKLILGGHLLLYNNIKYFSNLCPWINLQKNPLVSRAMLPKEENKKAKIELIFVVVFKNWTQKSLSGAWGGGLVADQPSPDVMQRLISVRIPTEDRSPKCNGFLHYHGNKI